MKKALWLLFILFGTCSNVDAGRFYWVGNSGGWSDLSHWATTSGGAVFHSTLPGPADSVFFDSNSFDANGRIVSLDTNTAFCAYMDWTAVPWDVEFNSFPTDTLTVSGSLLLNSHVTFNFRGLLRINAAAMKPTHLNFADNTLRCNVSLDADSVFLDSDLLLPYNYLWHTRGVCVTAGNPVSCRHFNTDTSLKIAVPVVNPKWFGDSTLTVYGSFALPNTMFFAQTGMLNFQNSVLDSNYINMYLNQMPCDVLFTGSKSIRLLSRFYTTGDMEFRGGLTFRSSNNPIYTGSFRNSSSLSKTISLGSSVIHLSDTGSSLYLTDTRLKLYASNASFVFSYNGDASVKIFTGRDSTFSFGSVELPVSPVYLYSSMTVDELIINPATHAYLAHGVSIFTDTINAAGDCGHYFYLASFCQECPSCGDMSDCPSAFPEFISTGGNITMSYARIRNISVSGAVFTANNSYDEGGNTGWVIVEPSSALTMYWIGGSGDWNDATHWSYSSGGVSSGCIPSRGNNVRFDAASFSSRDTVYLSDWSYCDAMNWTGTDHLILLNGPGKLFIADDLTLTDSLVWNNDQGAELRAPGAGTYLIDPHHALVQADWTINSLGTWRLSDTLISEADVRLEDGIFDLNGQLLSCNALLMAGTASRQLDYSSSDIILTGSDTVWNSSGTNLTIASVSGTVTLAWSGNEPVIVQSDSAVFGSILVQAPNTLWLGDGVASELNVSAGSILQFEPASRWLLDTLIASGSCNLPVTLSSFTGGNDTAQIALGSIDTLRISSLIIQNLTADTIGGKAFIASVSTGLGNTHGWSFSDTAQGAVYYWTGSVSKDWHQSANWTTVPPTGCVPGPADTVVFDNAYYTALASDTVLVNRNAFCRVMDWSGVSNRKPYLLLGASLQASGDVTLNDSLTFAYSGFSASESNAPRFTMAPDSGLAKFHAASFGYEVNTCFNGRSLNDTVKLLTDIVTDSTVSLSLNSGVFITDDYNVTAGIFQTGTDAPKAARLGSALFTIKYIVDLQTSLYLTLDADSASVYMPGNQSLLSFFDGGSHEFLDLTMDVILSDSALAVYKGQVYGNNSFRILKVFPGMNLYLDSSSVQTIDSLFSAIGTCADSIFIRSTDSGNPARLTCNSSDSIRTQCTVISDVIATNGAAALFSSDEGGNSGWAFNIEKATYASFTLPATTCFEDSIHFTNTSTGFMGNPLTFEWQFGDDSTGTQTHPVHLYDDFRDYVVTLISTYSLNGCQDTYTDTLTIYNPIVSLSTSQPDTTICQGDLVSFNAISPNDSPAYVFYTNAVPVVQSPDSTEYTTDTLSNGDHVFVEVTYMGCRDSSDVYTFVVHSLPSANLVSDDADAIICDGDSVMLTASGADLYTLYLNGSAANIMGPQNVWQFDTINNGDEFTLFARNSGTGCEAFSGDTIDFTVISLPVVGLASSESDTTICSGDDVIVYASGAAQYIYYLNGIPLAPPTVIDSIVVSGLNDGDIITIEGISLSGCRNLAPGALVFHVEVTPLVSLISDDPDSRICAGEVITFQSGGASTYQFYLNGSPVAPMSLNNSFDSTFTNGQTVTVLGQLGNCSAFADTTFTIDVRPSITWSWTDSEICQGDTITLTAHGDSIYQYFVDGIPQTPLQHDSVFVATGLTNGQVITVSGTPLACTPQSLVMTVHPVPLVSVSCSESDTAICEGDMIAFTASGSDLYGFYVNGTLSASYSTVHVFDSTGIGNGDLVTVQALSSFGCRSFSPDSFVVEVAPYPLVVLTSDDVDQIICAGDSVQFTAGGASLYEFFITGASQGAPSGANVFETGTLQNGAVVSVQGTTGYCTALSPVSFTFTVNAIPNVTFSPVSGISVCTGDTIRILAGGASTYQFFVDGLPWGAPSGNSLFACDTLSSGQEVSVAGILNGCTGISDSIFQVTVNNYPMLSFFSNVPTGNICFGDTVIFEGTGAQNYSFYLQGIPVSNDSLFVSDQLLDGQSVSLYGYNGVCGVWADTVISLQVNYVNVSLVSDMISTAVCSGTPVHFTASGADLYEFFIDGVTQGSPSSTNVFSPASLTNGQIVSVEGTSGSSGCSQYAFSDYYVHALTVPVVTASPSNQFCEGDSVLLSASAPALYQWYFNSGIIAGETSEYLWVYNGGNYQSEALYGGVGNVWSVGENSLGQFGNGTGINSEDFMASELTDTAIEVACGDEFTLALISDGSVKAWGRNEFGALGNGNFTDSDVPVSCGSLSQISQIAAGSRFALALKSDSTLASWGENTFGQLGYGNSSTSNFPFPVLNLNHVIQIAAGDDHALALTADGRVWAWGRNHAGQLGDSSLVNRNQPVLVNNLNQVVEIAAGANHSMALTADGSFYIWGSNASGQLGLGHFNNQLTPAKVNLFVKPVSFDGGFAHTLVADSMGTVWTWGDNSFGQLGVPALVQSLYPVKAQAGKGVISVKAGRWTSYALRADSNLIGWGLNNASQLGLGGYSNVTVPQIINKIFGVTSFDAGEKHFAAIPSNLHSCFSLPVAITMDSVPVIDLSVNGLVLSTATTGVSYQWFYNGSAIPGATGTSVTIAALGTYYVVVTFANGCSGFSPEYVYGTGIISFDSSPLLIYPNPSDGEFTVILAANETATSWSIFDALGQLVATHRDVDMMSVIQVSGLSLRPGVYSIQVTCSNGSLRSVQFTVTQ